MKDYYDLFKLSEVIPLKQIVLLKAIRSTFERRKTKIKIKILFQILNDPSLEKDFSRYIDRRKLDSVNFSEVTTRIMTQYLPIFELIENKTSKYKKIWNIHSFKWETI